MFNFKKPHIKISFLLIVILLMSLASLAQADSQTARPDRSLPASILANQLDSPIAISNADALLKVDQSLQGTSGAAQVIVRFSEPPVARAAATSVQSRSAHQSRIQAQQDAFVAEAMSRDANARVLGNARVALNAVMMSVDTAVLTDLAANPDVVSINPVVDYQMDLSETVPYIGASTVQDMGYDGSGIRVAVLDSGIDYYHADLGGSGDPNDYANDDPSVVEPGSFPTAKVVGGYDFVGSDWVSGLPTVPDADPLDDGPGAGHGTHVGHIIAGVGGVAPGADLYAVKVCSSISTACSGVGLIQGMEFAVDPNGDGDPSDHVDIINMSLGSDYGQPFDDDLSAAVENATAVGVLTVAAAGNGGDKPYIQGTPASAPTALSVAQTQVPSAALQLITVDGVDYPAVFQPWSVAPAGVISGPVQYADGAGGNLDGCAPFAADSLTGLVVLVDRGACNFTLKIKNIGDAGGAVGIIGLIAPGAPFSGGDGGDGPITIPGYMISQADSTAIKAAVGTTGTVDPDNQLGLVGQMVGSSARGPQNESTTLLKPEIGAPGASVSAIAGTGTGTGPFGGTSGATPMVAGSAALLMQASPHLSPLETKAVLMNNGETNIDTDPFTGLAPVARIGGGEVRVDRAVSAPAAAWENNGAAGALSFGFVDVSRSTMNLYKTVRVRNYSNQSIEYDITPTFRYQDDIDTGAVEITAPAKVRVPAGRDRTFIVRMTIHGDLLPSNFMNSGSMGADPSGLTLNEYDGYLILDDGSHPIHLAWHVLPRQDAKVFGPSALTFDRNGEDQVALTNSGVGTAQNDAYALLATSPNLPEGGFGEQSPTPDIRAVGINTFPVPAGFCSDDPSFIWAFAINTWERQQHLLPVSHQVWLDTNQDGVDDYVVLNRDVSGLGTISDGRQVAWALDLVTGDATAFFFAEHSMNTGNTILYICGEQIGLTGTDMLATNVNMYVVAQDFYYGGPGDLVDGLTVTPLGERYFGIPEDIAGKSTGSMTVIDFGLFPGNTPEHGVMLVTNGDRGAGLRGGATQATEALLFYAP
ncbi:MAG: S8 family serine peptidase [Ardenticatenaceae bacterium]|nr:S8 family serine peptidase [Ardenticatenaceae bacterium]